MIGEFTVVFIILGLIYLIPFFLIEGLVYGIALIVSSSANHNYKQNVTLKKFFKDLFFGILFRVSIYSILVFIIDLLDAYYKSEENQWADTFIYKSYERFGSYFDYVLLGALISSIVYVIFLFRYRVKNKRKNGIFYISLTIQSILASLSFIFMAYTMYLWV
ncbi:hypothetical protein Back11_54880 [Paenibacillus baekrokdamisoli]|uniref:Uncharacterized protein n=1 Tax=Paenibacillus baekrokdamisoli TaxID=1712516 RepID=A0A3G9JGN7_9BACL|nr:ABC-type uncharacterized transport system YnjBCD permease subunit [Paenibacillus baekrokdamisoli]BBH24143.1 hypothetical protein Back11_54880 [Paenibacillus baekrokdamisoli]